MEHQILDMVELIKTGKRISEEADHAIIELDELAIRIIDNHIQAFIVSKDILNYKQKMKVTSLLLGNLVVQQYKEPARLRALFTSPFLRVMQD